MIKKASLGELVVGGAFILNLSVMGLILNQKTVSSNLLESHRTYSEASMQLKQERIDFKGPKDYFEPSSPLIKLIEEADRIQDIYQRSKKDENIPFKAYIKDILGLYK